MPSSKLEFTGHAGDALAARLDMPVTDTRAFALFAHCFTCGKDIAAATRISRALTRQGIAVLRFDFTGLGSSEGEFANTNFSSNVEDLVLAADYLRDNFRAPAILIGHSLGGTAVLAASAGIPEVQAVVTIGAPAHPAHLERQFGARVEDIRSKGEVEVELAGRPFTIQKQFLDDLAANSLSERVRHLGKALLILHSPVDEVVDVDNARLLFEAARHPKSFVSLDDADHLLRKTADANYAAELIAAWASRYLQDEGESKPASLPEGTIEVTETGQGGFANLVRSGRHTLSADEPEEMGGTDTGPAPYDYLLAALGACTSMTLRMYASRKKLELDRVRVRLSHQRIHASDCTDCETHEGQISEIKREITLWGNLSDPERNRLMEIADRCPVHRTLQGEIKIRTRRRQGK